MDPKLQILLGNFKNIKSKQRKQRVRKMATEKFSAAIFFANENPAIVAGFREG